MGTLQNTFKALAGSTVPGTAGAAASGSIASLWQASQLASAGELMTGLGNYQTARFQEQVARNNATLDEAASRDATTAGEYTLFQQGLQARRLEARQTATFAANGVDVGVGTPVDVKNSTEMLADMDRMTIRHNAMMETYRLHSDAINARAMAGQYRAAGFNALTTGVERAGLSYVAGSQSVADKYAGFQRTGALGAEAPMPRFGSLGGSSRVVDDGGNYGG